MQDNDENEYNPSHSSTSKSITCSHQLCNSGPTCKNPKQPCPYTAKYASMGTSSSGSLVEDILHLASDGVNVSNTYVRAPIIIGYILYLIFNFPIKYKGVFGVASNLHILSEMINIR